MLWLRDKLVTGISLSGIPNGVILFCFFFSIYALTIYGELRFGDESQRYLEVQSIVERQSLVIPLIPANMQIGVGQHNYSQFEMGMTAMLVPFYVLGRTVADVVLTGDRDRIPTLFVNLMNPLITAFACVVLYGFSRALGIRDKTAILVALVFGLGTIAWAYSKGLYRENLQGLFLLLSVYAIYRSRQDGNAKWFWLSATALGYLVFIKLANAVMLPLFLAFLSIVIWEKPSLSRTAPARRWIDLVVRVCLFVLPAVVFLCIQGVVNAAKWGSFLELGPFNYRPSYFSLSNAPSAVANFLFSAERSIFIYAPPVILFLPAWIMLFLKDRIGAIFLFLLTAATVLVVGTWSSSLDQAYWGPKYLVEFVPMLILPLGLLWEGAQGSARRLWRIPIAAICLFGFLVQIFAALSNDREYLDVNERMLDLSGAIDFVRHGAIDSLAFSFQNGLFHINGYGWMSLALVAFFGIGLLLRWRQPERAAEPGSPWRGVALVAVAVVMQASAVVAGVAVPYADVLTEKGDTQYYAANNFLSENRFCQARGMFKTALALGTTHAVPAASGLETTSPSAQGTEIDIGTLLGQPPEAGLAQGEPAAGFLLSDHALKLTVLSDTESTLEMATDFFPVLPATQYELLGWLKSDGVYGSGYALAGWYEDNGKWDKGEYIESATVKGPHGLQPFRQVITTLPTTRRALVKAGFWQAYGSIRVEGIRLIQVRGSPPNQNQSPCVN